MPSLKSPYQHSVRIFGLKLTFDLFTVPMERYRKSEREKFFYTDHDLLFGNIRYYTVLLSQSAFLQK